jgi:NADPH:quinone reductase-like Zn-dependent oxidoreductase
MGTGYLRVVRPIDDRRQDVLVHGAAGAIGSAAAQLLKRVGANVTALGTITWIGPRRGADRVDLARDE